MTHYRYRRELGQSLLTSCSKASMTQGKEKLTVYEPAQLELEEEVRYFNGAPLCEASAGLTRASRDALHLMRDQDLRGQAHAGVVRDWSVQAVAVGYSAASAEEARVH